MGEAVEVVRILQGFAVILGGDGGGERRMRGEGVDGVGE